MTLDLAVIPRILAHGQHEDARHYLGGGWQVTAWLPYEYSHQGIHDAPRKCSSKVLGPPLSKTYISQGTG